MKKILTIEFIKQIILQIFISGMLIYYIQGYINNKWEPITAAEILKKESFIENKKQVYQESINLINRGFANLKWKNKLIPNSEMLKRNAGTKYPSEIEVNNCFAKLCIYSENDEIVTMFRKFFDKKNFPKIPTLTMGNYINLVRADLGYGNGIINPSSDDYQYIIISNDSTMVN